MATNEERREAARRLRNDASRPDIMSYYDTNRCMLVLLIEYDALQYFDASASELLDGLADLIEPEPERTCKWVWGEEWLESSPASPRELQWANWYLDCGCWDGDEDEFEDFDNPDEMPKDHWTYCPRCGAKVAS